jgi:hypothetical protein
VKVRAVRITSGIYRNATVSGVFELYEPDRNDPVEVLPSGKRQVKVMCAWRGVKPSRSCARIDVTSAPGAVEVLDDFSGEVVDNIGYLTDPPPIGQVGEVVPRIPTPAKAPVLPAPFSPAPIEPTPTPPPAVDRKERLQRLKLMLEIGVVAVTLIGGIIALVLRPK